VNTPITIQGWPLVEVCFNGPANEQEVQVWLDAMDALFEKNQPFGLLTRTSEHSDFSDAGRKAMGLWFKQSREKIGQLCVGVARIAPAEDAIERLAGAKMQAAMPCPIYASVDGDEARIWVQQKLAESRT
jgi:hypothetical protein